MRGGGHRDRSVPRLHVVVPDAPDDRVLAVVDAALAGGAPCIQVRSKRRSDRELFDLACAVVERCRRAGARCVVDDRVDVALASGADGVHVGADDLPVAAVRELARDRLLVGATARDAATARAHVGAGADYVGVGPVFGTASKAGLPRPFGPDGLRAVTAAVGVPVIAIAGITRDRVGAVLAAGAHGVAVIGAVADAPDPGAATRALLDTLRTPAGTRP